MHEGEHHPGAGQCPEAFSLDDIGHGVVTISGPVPAALREQVARAAANCPERAIIIS